MWANLVRDVIIIAFFVAVSIPIELYGDSWNHYFRGDRKLLEVWLDSERGGESIDTLINFIA